MLARAWWGATNVDDAADYLDYLRKTGLAEYARIPGHRRTLTMRRIVQERAEFLIISLWDSMEAVRRFAGDAPERAVFYPEDDRYLVARDEHVTHYEVLDIQPATL